MDRDFTGEYQINQNESIKIVLTDSSLFAKDPSCKLFKLIPRSPLYFIIENMSPEVNFVKDTLGKIMAAEIFMNGQRNEILKKIR